MASNNLPQLVNNDCFYGQFSFFPSIGAQYGIQAKLQSSFAHVPSVTSETSADSLSSPTWHTANNIQLPIKPFSDFEASIFNEDSDSTSIHSNLLKPSKKIQKTAQEPAKAVVARRRPNRKRNPWTAQEDAKLLELMKKHGQCWAIISSSLPGRTGKQVRDRYVNNLAPGIECGNWTSEEDEIIERLRAEKGNKWSFIASQLPGRSEAQVKNRYYSFILKKKVTLTSKSNQAYYFQQASENSESPITSPEIERISEPEMPEIEHNFAISSLDNITPVNSLTDSDILSFSQVSGNTATTLPSIPDEDRISYGNVIRIPVFPGCVDYQFPNPLSLASNQSSDISDKSPSNQEEIPFTFAVEEDYQVDGLLEHAIDCMDGEDPFDVEKFFADDLKKGETDLQTSPEFETHPSQREMDLRKRRAYLEVMLAETIKEMQEL